MHERAMHPKRRKAQSAMEYLMTYGWAILIISIALAALFTLGVFNPYTFVSKAQPGSCQVYRPEGPGTTQFESLQGLCTEEIPQYVASIPGAPTVYPITANIIGESFIPSGTNAISIFAWVKISPSDTSAWQRIVSYGTESCNGESAALEINGAGVTGSVTYDSECGPSAWTTGLNVNDNAWHFIGFVLPSGAESTNVQLYFDGALQAHQGTNTGAASVNPNYIIIGGGPGTDAMLGDIADVQIYNSALSENDIQALYLEGIGGAPIKLQNLVGWWPLNGNANDYSGNGNNGVATGVNFVSNWYSGYTQP
ncbi:MAG: LamG domain-containing protein [Candidatus Marsarchaeota archaeon]|nr:LamG domain-containing protein [Candidatus Marsarchaeota archaeon]MCL5418353.1 LamG domain-containing protein [Candidatus Marsarchaeota archaeon]